MKILSIKNPYIPVFGRSHSLLNVQFAETPAQLSQMLLSDTFTSKQKKSETNTQVNPKDVEMKFFGTYSFEEIEKVKNIVKAFKNSDLGSLKLILLDKLIKSAEELNTNDSDKVREKSNILILYLYALNTLFYAKTPKFNHTKYNDWYNTSLGEQNVHISETIFEHPLDKTLSLRGTFSKDELEECKNIEKETSSKTTEYILKDKFMIADKMYSIISANQSDFLGSFKNKDLENLRELAINYQALENILVSRGINTKEIEKIKYSTSIPDEIKTGDYIKGIGLVVNKFNIKSLPNTIIPTITVFSFNKKACMLKMYNLNELKKEAYIDEISPKSSQDKINEVNEKAKSFIKEQEDKAVISEIRFHPLDENKAFTFIKNAKKDKEKIMEEELKKGCYLVTHFLNKAPNKFPNAGKIIGFQLLELLEKNNAYPIVVKACAYNNGKRSPVALYQKIGFIPYSHSEEEISKLRKANNGRFPLDIPVYMYLPKSNTTSENIKKFREIFLSKVF